ncbi:hypothetical protein EES47_07165 [Streptomyces sp. ADI98-12]|nr:hypothetical protein EES47_07165 [Streptomyces sp. ADI98-12]
MSAWVMSTPLGTPVEPEVNMTYASESGRAAARSGAVPAGAAPTSTTGTAERAARSRRDASVTITVAPLDSTTWRTRSSG